MAALPELMRAYLEKYNGFCPFFGKVTGFRYVRCLDYFRFDKDGQFVGHVEKPFRRGDFARYREMKRKYPTDIGCSRAVRKYSLITEHKARTFFTIALGGEGITIGILN